MPLNRVKEFYGSPGIPGLPFLEDYVRIGGLQKTTMLDFPGKVSAVVFTQGCNFLCPYCHNPDLVLYRREPLAFSEVIAFLAQRRKVLEGVVISGGEPTLQEGLFSFCATIKSLGYTVKLDTNGSRPEVLQDLLAANLLDYVAMDIKADPKAYPLEICTQENSKGVSRSIALLEESQIAHEFRIPCVAPFIGKASFAAILEHIRRGPIFLQSVNLECVLQKSFFPIEGSTLEHKTIEQLLAQATERNNACFIR